MSVKIPPMSPSATFQLGDADVRKIIADAIRQRLQPLYGTVEVGVVFRKGEHDSSQDAEGDTMTATIRFTIQPKEILTR